MKATHSLTCLGLGLISALFAVATALAQTGPTISNQPYAQIVFAGQTAQFWTAANGNPSPSFQWQRLPAGDSVWSTLSNSGAYSGTTTSNLNVAVANTAMTGDQFRCVVTNAYGTATSLAASLTVNPAVAPTIYNLPAGITVNSGDYLAISPSVSGTDPYTYQWKKDGVNLAGATSVTFYKSGVTTADAGQYTLTATNYAGTSTSVAVVVTVNPAMAPTIYNLPAGITVDSGQALSIFPSIHGTQPMTYQWKKDGVALINGNASSYSKSNATTADSGQYTLTATNSVGTTTSSGISVVVNPAVAPGVFNLPTFVIVDSGGYFSWSPSVTGTPPMTYQWKKDGVALAGATNNYFSSSYFSGGPTMADSGLYTLTVTNSVGSFTSAAVVLTVNAAFVPVVNGMPASITANYGESIGIYPSVSGTSPITYQWKKDGVAVSGATSSYFNKSGVTGADGGQYTLTATNSVGTFTSSATTVTVNPAFAPVISNLPSGLSVNYGNSISLSPTIQGTQPISYQWKRDGVALSGATSSNYYKYGVTTEDAGEYTLVATNSIGTVTSVVVNVTINPAVIPAISGLPLSLTVEYGENIYLSPTITGTQPMTFQWKKDGVAIDGAISSYFSKYGAKTDDGGLYTLVASNSAGEVTSAATTVTVKPAVAPVISGLPPSLTLNYGNSLSLTPAISGTQPRTYQWKRNGVALSGATSSSYYKSAVMTADSGDYTLVVTNPVGAVTSSTVTVTVNPAVAPVVTNMPAGITLNYGEYFNINPTITGSGPMTYIWEKNGAIIPGAIAATFSKSGATPVDSGQYTVTVINPIGTVKSAVTPVTINPAIAPLILNVPSALNLAYGGSLTISPTISGTQPMTYQWKKDGQSLVSGGSAVFSNSYVTTADSGQYTLTVTNPGGTVTSSTVVVTVNPAVAPAIIGLPSIITLEYGNYLNLYPAVTGTQPMTYQWKKDGVDLPGATNYTYTKSVATPADGGQYVLSATNLVGTVNSVAVSVTVNPAVPPTITLQPEPVTVVAGSNVIFRVSATGTSPFTYQWMLDGQPVNGATNSTLIRTNVQAENAGNYSVEVTNPGGSVTSAAAALAISPPIGSIAASAGGGHSLFIKADGTLWAMGNNYFGQLGTGTSATPGSPLQITTGVVAASAGNVHSLFIKADGTLWAMGNNDSGQLGDGTYTTRLSPVQIATGVVAVSAGNAHSLFIKADGTLWAMGSNSSGQLGDGTHTSRPSPIQIATGIVAASAGNAHSLLVKADGSLWAMGSNGSGQLGDGTYVARSSPVQIATGVVAASAGNSHSLLVKADGTLWAMGYNGYGQLGDGTYNIRPNPVQIATGVMAAYAGSTHSLYVKVDNTIWGMGANYTGQLGDGTYFNHENPVQIFADVMTASAGSGYSLFVKTDGVLRAMGDNNYGQLGDGTNSSRLSPVVVASGPIPGPSASTGVVATDGSLANKIRVNWSATIGASSYEVWRNTSNDSGSADLLASNVANALYFDLTAVPNSTYYYWIKAVNAAGPSPFSNPDSGTAVVSDPPVVISQPDSQIVIAGAAVTFAVAATGSPVPAYQWQKDGVSISGATGSSYTIPQVAFGDEGTYRVAVSNSEGSVLSNPATLTVISKAKADFNDDGKSDLLWSNTSNGDRYIWLMNGTAVSESIFLGTIPLEWSATTGDYNHDGKTDLLWSNTSNGDRYVWLMNGTVVTENIFLGTIPPVWNVTTGDFNHDGKTDLLWSNTSNGDRYIWLMNGTSISGNVFLGTVSPVWSVSSGDFNHDGKTDLLWSNTSDGDRYVWLMNGTSIIGNVFLGTVPPVWRVSTGDFNHDGKTDLLWSNTDNGDRYFWLMTGTTISDSIFLSTVSPEWSVAP